MIEILKEALERCEALYKVSKDEPTMLNLVMQIANLKIQIEAFNVKEEKSISNLDK